MSAEKDLYTPYTTTPSGFRYGSIGPSVGNAVHHHPPSYSVYAPSYVEGSTFEVWTVVTKKQHKKLSVAQKFWSARQVRVKNRSRLCAFNIYVVWVSNVFVVLKTRFYP
jgi:hypothetical protein